MLRNHIPVLFFSLATFLWIYSTRKSPDVISNISISTAYPGLALLAATLIVGPLRDLLKQPNKVSTDFRRDLGFWAAVVSLIHVLFGLQVHLRGRMWLLFLRDNPEFPYIRFDMFGAANYTGLFATVILIALFATSSDWALQKLGIKRWKLVQRWNYLLFFVVGVHGILYQIIEKRIALFVFIFIGILAFVLIVRIFGYFSPKRL